MKSWQSILLGILIGIALTAAVFLAAFSPRGEAVRLQPPPTPAPVQVQVDGAVRRPGVYALPRDARAGDAVTAAGGLSDHADAAAVNLAARVKDGEKIVIPRLGETPALAGGPTAVAASKSSRLPTPGGPVNINTASAEALQDLPGIGPSRADQIIAYREAHGGFKTIEEIQEVSGIGPATFERLKDLITVD